MFFLEQAAGDPFEAIDQFGYRDLGRIMNEQMHMILFTVCLYKFSLKVPAYSLKNLLEALMGLRGQYSISVFCHKDQMDMEIKNTMSSGS